MVIAAVVETPVLPAAAQDVLQLAEGAVLDARGHARVRLGLTPVLVVDLADVVVLVVAYVLMDVAEAV